MRKEFMPLQLQNYFMAVIVFFHITLHSKAGIIDYQWNNTVSPGTSSTIDLVNSTVDQSGNFYQCYRQPSSGYSPLAKYSSTGSSLSTVTPTYDVYDMQVGIDDYLYLTGECSSSDDFDLYGSVKTTSGGVFIAKYDLSFNIQWVVTIGASKAGNIGFDSDNNLLITGRYTGTVDLDPGSGTDNHSSVYGTSSSYSNYNIFFFKLDTNGNYLWGKNIDAYKDEEAFDLCVDHNDNIIITGNFTSSSNDFDPGAGTSTLQQTGDYAGFIAKYDASGNFIWAGTLKGNVDEIFMGVVCDQDNNIYLGGHFDQDVDFDPSSGSTTANVYNGSSSSNDYWNDIFLAKYNADGNFQWVKTFGNSYEDYCYDIAIDKYDFVYLTGYVNYSSYVDFDPSSGTAYAKSTNSYFTKYDNDGNLVWANGFSKSFSLGSNSSKQITVDNDLNLYLALYIYNGGSSSGTFDLDPSSGTANVSVGSYDKLYAFAKYSQCSSALSVVVSASDDTICYGQNINLTVSGANSYVWTYQNWTGSSITFMPDSSSSYIVKGTSSGCVAFDTIAIYVTDAYPQIIQSGNTLAVTQSFATYQWYLDGVQLSGANDSTYTPTSSGTYYLNVINNLGCSGTSNSITYTLPEYIVSGQVYSENGNEVKNLDMNLTGTLNQLQNSADGSFSFTVPAYGNYTLSASKNNDLTVLNGISTLDILYIQKHILKIDSLSSPYKIIAADVNSSQSITTSDILYIKSMILGNTNSFPGNKLWTFVNSDYTFSDNYNPFPYDSTRSYTSLTASKYGQDFIGVKLGDVNNSWDNTITKTASLGTLSFLMDNQTALEGDTIVVPVYVKDFKNIGGYQYTISWKASDLNLLTTQSAALSPYFGTIDNSNGNVTTLWYDQNATGITLADGTILFTLTFLVNGTAGNTSTISITSDVVVAEAYDINMNNISVNSTSSIIAIQVGNVTSIDEYANIISEIKCFPNPTNGDMYIHFTLKSSSAVKISIVNTLGKLMHEDLLQGMEGINSLYWDASKYAAGTYLIKLSTQSKLLSVARVQLIE